MSERPHRPFREIALEHLIKKLGDPREIKLGENASIYRWVLERPMSLSVYVTLDSPELPNVAHLIVSDPCAGTIEPIVSLTARTLAEIDVIADRIVHQWHNPGPRSPDAKA